MSRGERYYPSWVKVGAIVKLKRGWTGMKIIKIDNCDPFEPREPIIHAVYRDDNVGDYSEGPHADKVRTWNEFEPYTSENHHWATEGTIDMAHKLCTWKNDKDEEVYGFRLAINSNGDWVMESKGSGEIHIKSKAEVSVVVPHTVDVQFIGAGSNSTKYSYWTPKDALTAGDLVLMDDGQFVKVVAVDTSHEKANKHLTGVVLEGRLLEVGEKK